MPSPNPHPIFPTAIERVRTPAPKRSVYLLLYYQLHHWQGGENRMEQKSCIRQSPEGEEHLVYSLDWIVK